MITERVEEKWQNYPDDEYKYFLYERDNGMMFFNSIEERQNMFESVKDGYLDDYWNEEVENIVAGEVTHTTSEVDRVDKPELDEEGMDEKGEYWPNKNWDYICDYALTQLAEAQSNQEGG